VTQDRPSGGGEAAGAPHLDDAIYDALYAALSASARGRAFLDEVVRRGRNADTVAALAALARIEAKLNASLAAPLPSTSPETSQTSVSLAAPSHHSAPPSIETATHDEVPAPEPEPHPRIGRPDLPRAASDDLIARVMALSPEERIALFS
jgi:hypothetical protein